MQSRIWMLNISSSNRLLSLSSSFHWRDFIPIWSRDGSQSLQVYTSYLTFPPSNLSGNKKICLYLAAEKVQVFSAHCLAFGSCTISEPVAQGKGMDALIGPVQATCPPAE